MIHTLAVTRLLLAALLLFVVHVPNRAAAQETDILQAAADEVTVPPRVLHVVHSEEEDVNVLFDIAVVDERFLASIPIVPLDPYPGQQGSGFGDGSDLRSRRFLTFPVLTSELVNLMSYDGLVVPYMATSADPRQGPPSRLFGRPGADTERTGKILALIEHTPMEHRPATESLDDLTACATKSIRLNGVPGLGVPGTGSSDIPRIEIFAPSAELAEQRARTLLTLYDYGMYLPCRQSLLDVRRRYAQHLTEVRKAHAEAEAEIERSEAAIENREVIPPEEMSDLKVKQRTLMVDLYGIRERIAACDRYLKESNRTDILRRALGPGPVDPATELLLNRISQLEDLKISAEVELAGIEASKKLLDQMIEEGVETRSLVDRLSRPKILLSSREKDMSSTEKKVVEIDLVLESWRPIQVVDSTITIHPVKWQSRDATR